MTRAGWWGRLCLVTALAAVATMTGCSSDPAGNGPGRPSGSPGLTLSPSATTYEATEGDSATTVQVTATRADGSADSFTVAASPSGVVDVGKGTPSGTTTPVTLTPLAAGTATLTFTSGSDATLFRTLSVTVLSEYNNPTAVYTLSPAVVFPAVAATTVYEDDRLTLNFDSAPTLGHGAIRIFRASDDALVDRIALNGESDTVGPAGHRQRTVATTPVVINGTTVTITPHRGKLLRGTSYYVGIPATSFTGATLSGRTFAGLGKAAGWFFTVHSYGPPTGLASVTVGSPGDTLADFHTLQSALDYYVINSSVSSPVINLKNGTYRELLYLYNRPNVTILGESRAGVILQYDNSEGSNSGDRSVFLAEDSDMLTLDTLTLKNTHIRSGSGTDQAEAICFRSSTASPTSGHRLVARNANFYSEQTTLQLQGYTWFYNTKVSGNVDAIWGNNRVSLFEASTLEMLGDSAHPATTSGYANGTGGTLVQARTYPGGKGFVFAGCSLTYADGPGGVHVATDSNASSYLARATAGTWQDSVVFLNCRMDTHIPAIGWSTTVPPYPSTPTASSGWREYNSLDMSGTPLSVAGRSSSSRQLTGADVSAAGLGDYTQTASYPTNTDRATLFSAIGWAPVP